MCPPTTPTPTSDSQQPTSLQPPNSRTSTSSHRCYCELRGLPPLRSRPDRLSFRPGKSVKVDNVSHRHSTTVEVGAPLGDSGGLFLRVSTLEPTPTFSGTLFEWCNHRGPSLRFFKRFLLLRSRKFLRCIDWRCDFIHSKGLSTKRFLLDFGPILLMSRRTPSPQTVFEPRRGRPGTRVFSSERLVRTRTGSSKLDSKGTHGN